MSGLLTWLRRRLRPVPAPPGADEDRAHEEEQKRAFAEQLHDARRRVHFLEVAAVVRQRRRKDDHEPQRQSD